MPEPTSQRSDRSDAALTPETVLQSFRRAKERRSAWEAKWSFSCWNKGDPNLAKIEAMQPGNRVFDSCLRIARRAVSGCLDDPTQGATHYHTADVTPPWSRGRPVSAEIGKHLFYNTIE